MEDNRVPALVMGALLVFGGTAMLWSHWRTWRARSRDPELDPHERAHYHRQFRRRMQATGLFVLIGVLLPVGDAIPWRQYPALFAAYWLFVIGLAVWVILLAFGDFSSTRAHSQTLLARLQRQHAELQRQADDLRRRTRDEASRGG